MMLDEPIAWNDPADKEALLDYAFDHHRVTKANDAMLRQYGASREQFVGITPRQLFAHDLEYGRRVWRSSSIAAACTSRRRSGGSTAIRS